MDQLRMKTESLPNMGDEGLVVRPAGPIRARIGEQFRESVNTLLEDLTALIIDFSDVEYIDSATTGYLLNVHDKLQGKGGTLVLTCLPTSVQVVIDSIGLTTFFTVCTTLEEAIQETE